MLLEGTASGVAERAKQMSELVGAAGGSPAVAVSEAAPARWGLLPSPSTVVRVSFWVSSLGAVLDALAATAAAAGVRPAVSGQAGAGALYACLDPGTSDEAAARFVTVLRERLVGAGGSAGPRGSVAVLVAPPAVLAAGLDGTIPGLALMRAVKDQFDPGHRMFPGRLGWPVGDTSDPEPPRHS